MNHAVSASGPIKLMMVGALPVNLGGIKGGVEAVIMNLLRAFTSETSLKVVHLAFSKEVNEEATVSLSDNVCIRFVPFASKFELIEYAVNASTLNRIIREEQPDLIHIQEITPHILRFIAHPNDRIIVTQHGIMAEELKYASGASQRMKCLFKSAVEKFVFPRFKNVIFISNYNRRLYRGNLEKEALIFNPVNPIFFEKVTSESKRNNILYVGVLSRRKNIKLVIEALHTLNQQGYLFDLHVAGGFKEAAYEDEVMSVVDQFGLKERIRFHGWLTQENLRELYRNCPIFILPSLQETLPVSIAEAMAQGKIVVASDVGGIREMFTDRVSGFLFMRNDKNDLVRTLGEVFTLSDKESVGEIARREAYDKFTPEKIASRTLNFYREVLAGGTPKEGGDRS